MFQVEAFFKNIILEDIIMAAITAAMVKELRESDWRRYDGMQEGSYRNRRRYGSSC